MSSFVVDDDTINAIVSALVEARYRDNYYPSVSYHTSLLLIQDNDDARAEFGKDLYDMNVEAVMQRYPDCRADTNRLPGCTDKNGNHAPYKYRPAIPPVTMQFYKSLGCFLYQCSEGNIPETPLYQALEKYLDSLAHHIVDKLPEYDKATWG